MSRRMIAAVVVLGLLAAAGTTAYALVNPNFTPANLVEKADLILALRIKPPEEGSSRCGMEIVKCIKGKMPKNRQVLDLSGAANREHAKAIRQMLAAQKGGLGLLFIGKGERDEQIALLHVSGKWVALSRSATTKPKL